MPQIASTTFEAEGVRLPPQKLKELKAITAERDEQRKRATGDEEWRGLLDHAQRFFRASSILVGLAHLLRHILAEHRVPAPSETILVKVLVAGQKKSMEVATQQFLDLGMQPPLPLPPRKWGAYRWAPRRRSGKHPRGQAEDSSRTGPEGG